MPAPAGIAEKNASAGRYSGEKQIAAAVCIINKTTGPSPTGTTAHPRIIPHILPTQGLSHPPATRTQTAVQQLILCGEFYIEISVVRTKKKNRTISHRHDNTPTNYTTRSTHPRAPPTTHPLPTDQATTAVQQCISMYGGIPVREEHLVGSGVLRTRSTVRNAGEVRCFTTLPAISWIASELPPTNHPPRTTHPPTNPPPQRYTSSGAVRTEQPTTAAQQYSSTHHSGTPVVRQEPDGICTFLPAAR